MDRRFEPLMIGLLVVALLFGWLTPNDTAKHVAEAVAITAFLALTVDRYLKHRFAKEVARDVGPYVFAYGLPDKVADEIIYIRGISLMRSHLELTFYFRDVGNTLAVETEMSYVVVNYADKAKPFPLQVAILEDRYSHIEPCSIQGIEATGSDFTPNLQLSNPNVTRNPNPPVLQFSQEIQVTPNKSSPSNRVWWKTREIMGANDEDVVFFPQPAIGLTVRVAEKPLDLAVEVFFGHRNYEQVTKTPKVGQTTRWHLDATFLPWSSVTLSWKKVGAPMAPKT